MSGFSKTERRPRLIELDLNPSREARSSQFIRLTWLRSCPLAPTGELGFGLVASLALIANAWSPPTLKLKAPSRFVRPCGWTRPLQTISIWARSGSGLPSSITTTPERVKPRNSVCPNINPKDRKSIRHNQTFSKFISILRTLSTGPNRLP